jgi:hypothetical protein
MGRRVPSRRRHPSSPGLADSFSPVQIALWPGRRALGLCLRPGRERDQPAPGRGPNPYGLFPHGASPRLPPEAPGPCRAPAPSKWTIEQLRRLAPTLLARVTGAVAQSRIIDVTAVSSSALFLLAAAELAAAEQKKGRLVDFVSFIPEICALVIVCVMASYDNGDSSPETAVPRGGTPRQPRAASRQNKTLDQF